MTEIDPLTYPDFQVAMKGLDDVEREDLGEPSRIVQKLLEFAEGLDPIKGRIILVLDEVGLYIARDSDRLTELDYLSEAIKSTGKGKIWLICSAQETLNEQIENVEKKKGQFYWLDDRFQLKFMLTPRNINKVVKVRMLDKKSSKKIRTELETAYNTSSGNLLQSSMMSGVDHEADLFEKIMKEDFVDYYPLLPYHIYLMQEIFGAIRSKSGISERLTGRERAVLKVVQYVLKGGSNTANALINQEVGNLVTFDMVYNAISSELKDIDSTSKANIEGEIEKLGEVDELPIASVAKALYLLQEVNF